MTSLLTDIELFMSAHGLSATKFGQDALGDRHFVKQLRKGRRVWPETDAKVRQFMVTYKPPQQQEAA
jgi:hypothetical protein